MRSFSSYATIIIFALLMYGCATQQVPVKPVSIFYSEPIDSTLTYVVDNRMPDMKKTKGNGTTFIEYGDEAITPTPILILDNALEIEFKDKLNGRRVTLNQFIISRGPVAVESVYAPGIAGVSVTLAILVDLAETSTNREKFECDLKGTLGDRSWWVRHDIPPSDHGAAVDIEKLVRQCVSDAIRKIGGII